MDSLPPGGVLTLDLAQRTGWAYGFLETRKPWWSHFDLAPDDTREGAKYAALADWLYARLPVLQPSRLILEAPLPLHAQKTERVARQQYCLRGVALGEAARAGVPHMEFSVDLVRSDLMGRARFPKGEAKTYVRRYLWNEVGWKVVDHNAADAAMLWRYWHKQMTGGHFHDPANDRNVTYG